MAVNFTSWSFELGSRSDFDACTPTCVSKRSDRRSQIPGSRARPGGCPKIGLTRRAIGTNRVRCPHHTERRSTARAFWVINDESSVGQRIVCVERRHERSGLCRRWKVLRGMHDPQLSCSSMTDVWPRSTNLRPDFVDLVCEWFASRRRATDSRWWPRDSCFIALWHCPKCTLRIPFALN